MFRTGGDASIIETDAQSTLTAFLVGISRCEDDRLPEVKSAHHNVVAWLVQAVRMGIDPKNVYIFCKPVLTIGDIAEAMLQWDLPKALKIRVLWTFVEITQRARGEAGRVQVKDWEDIGELTDNKELFGGRVGHNKIFALQDLLLQLYPEQADALHVGFNVLIAARELGHCKQDLDPEAQQNQPEKNFNLRHKEEKKEQAQKNFNQRCKEAKKEIDGSLRIGERPFLEYLILLTQALTVYGFDPASRDNLRKYLRRASQDIGQESGPTRGLFVFSGHGGLTKGNSMQGGELALVTSSTKRGRDFQFEGLDDEGLDDVLTVQDFKDALGEKADRWTLVLDACHTGGPENIQGSTSTSAWTKSGLKARIIAASQEGQRAAEARMGYSTMGVMTWALTTTLSRWLPVNDGQGRAMGVSHGNLVLRANMLLDALSLNQRISLSAPDLISDMPFLGYDPATKTATDPNEQVGGIEVSTGSNEIYILKFIEQSTQNVKAVIIVIGASVFSDNNRNSKAHYFIHTSGIGSVGDSFNLEKSKITMSNSDDNSLLLGNLVWDFSSGAPKNSNFNKKKTENLPENSAGSSPDLGKSEQSLPGCGNLAFKWEENKLTICVGLNSNSQFKQLSFPLGYLSFNPYKDQEPSIISFNKLDDYMVGKFISVDLSD